MNIYDQRTALYLQISYSFFFSIESDNNTYKADIFELCFFRIEAAAYCPMGVSLSMRDSFT